MGGPVVFLYASLQPSRSLARSTPAESPSHAGGGAGVARGRRPGFASAGEARRREGSEEGPSALDASGVGPLRYMFLRWKVHC